MSLRFQRLVVILISLILISGSVILILTNSKKNIVFFYTPSELIFSDKQINQKVRIGGLVKKQSMKRNLNSKNNITFIITDNKNDIHVNFKGILPDLFREGQGTVVEGILINKNKINAEKVFAKHDENYMPASIKNQIKSSDYWRRDYSQSSLSNEKTPEFTTVSLTDKNIELTFHDLKNKIVLINFFASWCLPCKVEHPLLMDLKNNFPKLIIFGFNHKDKREEAIKFLLTNGNPYSFVGVDLDGMIGLKFGVFGLPETFLINSKGDIIFKHTGPLSKDIIQKEILPNL